jgi:hypothetical protein
MTESPQSPSTGSQSAPMHGVWLIDQDGIRTACGALWKRGSGMEPIRATSQAGDVTCPSCKEMLRKVGLAV